MRYKLLVLPKPSKYYPYLNKIHLSKNTVSICGLGKEFNTPIEVGEIDAAYIENWRSLQELYSHPSLITLGMFCNTCLKRISPLPANGGEFQRLSAQPAPDAARSDA